MPAAHTGKPSGVLARTKDLWTGLRASYTGAAYVFVGQAGATLLSLVSLVFVARAIGPATYGAYAAAVSFLGVFGILADAGLSQYTIREAVHRPDDAPAIYANVLKLRLVLASCSAALCVTLGIMLRLPASAIVLALLGTTLVTGAWGAVFLATFHVAQDFAVVARLRLLEATLGAASMVAVAKLRPTLGALAAVTALNALVVNLVTFLAGRSRARLDLSGPRPLSWAPLRASLWFGATSLLWYAGGRASIALAAWILRPEALGSYAAGFRLADPLTFLATSVMVSHFPKTVAEQRHGPVSASRLMARSLRMALAGVALALAASLAAPVVVPWVLGPRFASAVPAFQVLVWSLPIAFATVPTSLLADATGHQHLHFFNGLFLVGAGLLILLWATPRYGVLGPAFGVLGGQLVGAVVGIPVILLAARRSGVVHWERLD